MIEACTMIYKARNLTGDSWWSWGLAGNTRISSRILACSTLHPGHGYAGVLIL